MPRVLFFAAAREATGLRHWECDGERVGDVLDRAVTELGDGLARLLPYCTLLVGDEPATRDTLLGPAGELAVLPPVSGGAEGSGAVVITGLRTEPIEPSTLVEAIAMPWCGAVVTFEGLVRDHNAGRKVTSLFYEAYETRAEHQLDQLANHVVKDFELGGAVAVHRTGVVPLGHIAVLVATTAPHRSACFDATRRLIDEIKSTVAIWKKEVYADGGEWVGLDT